MLCKFYFTFIKKDEIINVTHFAEFNEIAAYEKYLNVEKTALKKNSL